MNTPKQAKYGGFWLYGMTKILYKMTNLNKWEWNWDESWVS